MDIQACPSCSGKIQPIKGHRFHCETCDVIFRITREGPTVETIGPVDRLIERVDNIEQQIGRSQTVQDPKPAAASPLEQSAEDPNDDEQLDEDPTDEQLDEDPDDDVNELWGE